MNIVPTGQILGATVTGVDLAQPLSHADFSTIVRALAEHGVLRFPRMQLRAEALRRFSQRFGSLQALRATLPGDTGVPEVSTLSNIVRDGKPIGIPDAGQSWHTDMTYNKVVGYINVLVAYEVPMRDGKPLGATEFVNTAAAYDDLPDEMKERLANATAMHDLNLYWEYVRREKGSTRSALTAQERAERPPVRHPVFLTHPVSGRKVIYVNPSYCETIEGMPDDEGRRVIQQLFDHMLQPKYRYMHHWVKGDLLMWDHLWTWHNAVADYGPDEHRLMIRCQVTADRVFEPDFLREPLSETA
ncbi:TauD/TfdA family dioxygenase [Verticiella sediminum]|uniref:TauD/TfdA family dioxygenase n=1 Tax=Verticiella sediminum TaxID=1247510 RepID=A0A556AWR8_9BURK|nr:TauD/TfdA family dioxygenase [Verticiella sediminum]TSH97388.1 TauD/TfdA family dioxygenase [Verticiella sediminum]